VCVCVHAFTYSVCVVSVHVDCVSRVCMLRGRPLGVRVPRDNIFAQPLNIQPLNKVECDPWEEGYLEAIYQRDLRQASQEEINFRTYL